MMFWYGNGMSGWGYALMTISMVVFWVLVIAGVVALVRYAGQAPAPSSPERLLAERLARGEIDEEEYRQRLETLRTGAHPVTRS